MLRRGFQDVGETEDPMFPHGARLGVWGKNSAGLQFVIAVEIAGSAWWPPRNDNEPAAKSKSAGKMPAVQNIPCYHAEFDW